MITINPSSAQNKVNRKIQKGNSFVLTTVYLSKMSKSLTDKKEWPKGMIFWPISLFDSTIVATSIFLKRNVESRSSLLSWVKKSVQKVIFYTDIYMKEKTRILAQTFLHTLLCWKPARLNAQIFNQALIEAFRNKQAKNKFKSQMELFFNFMLNC